VRKTALIAFPVALLAALAFTFAASGGGRARSLDVSRTANASSVHYQVMVTLTLANNPTTLEIAGGATHDKLVAHLALGLQSASIMRDPHFVYEGAPQGIVVVGKIHWLRLRIDAIPQASKVFSTLRSLTPSPLLHVVSEASLRPVGTHGVFAGPVAYDDPIVRTALHQLGGGFEFRGLHLRVAVGPDGRIHHLLLTGRTADGSTSFALRARLFGFGTPVRVHPPKPGTFMDPALANLQS
jgi:hypothetical protein